MGVRKDFRRPRQKENFLAMTRNEIITAIESGKIVYCYTNRGCELVLDADQTEVFTSASGWLRWGEVKKAKIKFRVLNQRGVKFTVDDLTSAAEEAALIADYDVGIADMADELVGPEASDDWYWDIH